jgi:hypothetical protein
LPVRVKPGPAKQFAERDEYVAIEDLTRDGRYVLPTGSTADLYINDCGDAVARRELVAVHEARTPLSAAAPTASSSLEIEGPLAACELLDYAVTRVYVLHPVTGRLGGT